MEFDPPRRVTVSWGFVGSDTLPASASTVSFQLTATATGTRLDLVHSGLPNSEVPGHSAGWSHFAALLSRVSAGERLEADTWAPAR